MIVFLSMLVGAGLGALTARRRKGNRLDMLQYAAVYAIIFAIGGTVLSIVLDRTVL